MQSSEIHTKFLEFFRERGHAILPSASLMPENDTTTLFTSSGMQPLVKFLLGVPHPAGKRLADSQKCFRAEDIEAVGDNRHTTFFEMLGNWSLGDYFKQEQLPWIFEFLTDIVGLSPERLYVTVFAGDDAYGIPRDTESAGIWKELFKNKGIDAKDVVLGTSTEAGRKGMQEGRIFYYDASKNWWSRAGIPDAMPPREPGGPDSEIFFEFASVEHDKKFGEHCHPNCDCGRFMEIGNSVFMEYLKREDGTFEKLVQHNVDFGGGLERITAASLGDPDIFHVDTFRAMQEKLGMADDAGKNPEEMRRLRIILDHVRASVFLVGDGVLPSNKAQGYILRRLVRRSVAHANMLKLFPTWLSALTESVAVVYVGVYPEIHRDLGHIVKILEEERARFEATLKRGIVRFEACVKTGNITSEEAFDLHQSYGFPIELTIELAKERGIDVDMEKIAEALKKHQELSRAGATKKFGGHGLILDTGELKAANEEELQKVTRLHTATHLLQQALREVLGSEVAQRGSDITAERTRFDFSFPRKLTPEEMKKVEDVVNEKIKEDLPMQYKEMPKSEAEKTGALYFFSAKGGSAFGGQEKYPDPVKVYYIGTSLEEAWSKEFCGGPHVSRTGEIGTFKIIKEEAVSAGVRRIRAIVE